MDQRIGWIQPEQTGPAHKTWKKMWERSTQANVTSSTVFNRNQGHDYIPLNCKTTVDIREGVNNAKNSVNIGDLKRKRIDNLASTNGLDVASLPQEEIIPWKVRNYPQNPVG